jgi:site-specific DNA-methyltransferase (adenine-specific)
MHQTFDANLLLGDCLSHLREMPIDHFQLIYLDPPFYTQRNHSLQPRDRSQTFRFDDSWPTPEAYAAFILDRLKELHRVLSRTGSIYFHCDRNASHIARNALDKIFGAHNFRAEIIWAYRRWSNAAKGLLPAHQNILYYTKSDDFVFNQVFDEYSPSTNVDQILQRRGRDSSNKSIYLRDEDGNVVPHANKRGVPLGDVWDIPFLNPKAKERVGYPTQKPLLLLERVIGLSSNIGDRVLDPFCGSGTTLVAAASMQRVATGIDVSAEAVTLSKQRLTVPIRSSSRLHENGRESYRSADQILLQHLAGIDFFPVHRNAGIDAILKQDLGGAPITVRIQRVGESLLDAAELLYRASVSKGARVMFLVAVRRGGAFAFTDQFPPGVMCIDSPTLQIREHIINLKTLESQAAGKSERHRPQWTGEADSLF